jgi:hypothetical protein
LLADVKVTPKTIALQGCKCVGRSGPSRESGAFAQRREMPYRAYQYERQVGTHGNQHCAKRSPSYLPEAGQSSPTCICNQGPPDCDCLVSRQHSSTGTDGRQTNSRRSASRLVRHCVLHRALVEVIRKVRQTDRHTETDGQADADLHLPECVMAQSGHIGPCSCRNSYDSSVCAHQTALQRLCTALPPSRTNRRADPGPGQGDRRRVRALERQLWCV